MRPQTVPVEKRHLRTSPLSGQASTSSLLVPDTLGLPLRGSVMPNPAKTVKLYELLATLQFKVFDFVDQLAISSITGTPDIG